MESSNSSWMRGHCSSPRRVVQGWLGKLLATKTWLRHKPEVSCTRLVHAAVCAMEYRLAKDTCMHASLRSPLTHPVCYTHHCTRLMDSPGTWINPLVRSSDCA